MTLEQVLAAKRGVSLIEAANQLSVEPFEIVRLIVAMDDDLAPFRFPPERVVAIAEFAGIEWWWTDPARRVLDENPRRSVLRTASRDLLMRASGGMSTRLDNLMRGLDAQDAQMMDQAVAMWVDNGSVIVMEDVKGTQASIALGAESLFARIADGSDTSVAITALCQAY